MPSFAAPHMDFYLCTIHSWHHANASCVNLDLGVPDLKHVCLRQRFHAFHALKPLVHHVLTWYEITPYENTHNNSPIFQQSRVIKQYFTQITLATWIVQPHLSSNSKFHWTFISMCYTFLEWYRIPCFSLVHIPFLLYLIDLPIYRSPTRKLLYCPPFRFWGDSLTHHHRYVQLKKQKLTIWAGPW